MPPTTDGGKNAGLRSSSDCVLHIAHIRAARDEPWCASYHAIPNDTRVFVGAFARAQQLTLESPVERRVNLFAGLDHLVLSSQNIFLEPTTIRAAKPWCDAGLAGTKEKLNPKKQKMLEPTIAS